MYFIIFCIVLALAYIIMIGLFIIGWNRIANKNPLTRNDQIEISIIVAFRNEQDNLPKLIESILSQDYPKDKFELILVDDHSIDESVSTIKRYQADNIRIQLVKLQESEFGKKSAIALALSFAKNPLVAITDADCSPNPAWLSEISKYTQMGYVLMIGPVLMKSNRNFYSYLQALEYSSLMSVAAGSAGIGHSVIASSANLAFRNDIICIKKGILEPSVNSGDDMFILHHVKKGWKDKIIFMKSLGAEVHTTTANNIFEALKQRQRWASKSSKYTDLDTIFAGLIVLVFNLMMLAVLFYAFIQPFYFLVFGGLLILKSLFDFRLMASYLSFFGQARLLKVFLPLQLMYPFYVVFAFFSGILSTTNWKERKIRK